MASLGFSFEQPNKDIKQASTQSKQKTRNILLFNIVILPLFPSVDGNVVFFNFFYGVGLITFVATKDGPYEFYISDHKTITA
jgi:hypothetical protein